MLPSASASIAQTVDIHTQSGVFSVAVPNPGLGASGRADKIVEVGTPQYGQAWIQHGDSSIGGRNADQIIYSSLGHSGPDTFTYVVERADGTRREVRVSVRDQAVGPPAHGQAHGRGQSSGDVMLMSEPGTGSGGPQPYAVDDWFNVIHDTVDAWLVVGIGDYNASGDLSVITIVSGPSHGSVWVDPNYSPHNMTGSGAVFYTPDPGYIGEDSFVYQRTNDYGSSQATALINVINRPPVGVADSYTAVIDHPLTMNLVWNDGDPDPPDDNNLTVVIETQPSHGTLSVSGGSVTYTPDEGYTGPDSFTYRPKDPFVTSVDPVSVTLSIINPAASYDTTLVTVTAIGADFGLATTEYEEGLPLDDPAVQAIISARQQARLDAIADYESGSTTAYDLLLQQADSVKQTIQTDVDNAEADYEQQLDDNWDIFANAVQDAQSDADTALQAADSAFNSAVNGLLLAGSGLSNVTGSSASLIGLSDVLTQLYRTLVAGSKVADQQFDSIAETAGDDFNYSALDKLQALIVNGWDASRTLEEAMRNSSNALDAAVYAAAQTYVTSLNSINATRHAAEEAAHAAYLSTVRGLKQSLEATISTTVDAQATIMLDAYADYYQSLAQFTEQTLTTLDMKAASKDLAITVTTAEIEIVRVNTQSLIDFVTGEQTAMVTMAVTVAVADHAGLMDAADAAKLARDTTSDAGKASIYTDADAEQTYQTTDVSGTHDFADGMSDVLETYGSAIFNAAMDHDSTILQLVKVALDSSIDQMSSWLGGQGPTGQSQVAGMTQRKQLVDAEIARIQAKMTADRDFENAVSTASDTLIHDDHLAEKDYSDAVIQVGHTATTLMADNLNGYESTISTLDRDYVDDASAKDVDYVTIIVNTLKSKNLAQLPSVNAAIANLQTALAALQATATADFEIGAIGADVYKGKFDILSVEEAMAPKEAGPDSELDPMDAPQPARDLSGQFLEIRAGYDQIKMPHRWAQDDAVIDTTGNTVGYIYIDHYGNLWVKRFIGGGGGNWYFKQLENVEPLLGTNTTASQWDSYFSSGFPGVPPTDDFGGATPEPTDIWDIVPPWLLEIVAAPAGQSGNSSVTVDTVINSVDSFFAGMAHTITGGWTTKIREGVYGNIATRNHEGGLWTAGQVAGVAPAIAVSIYSGAGPAHAGTLLQTSRAVTLVTTANGIVQSANNIASTGTVTAEDVLNFLPVVGAGVSRFAGWVKCFEGGTPVAVGWVGSTAFAELESAAGGVVDLSTRWSWAATGIAVLYVAVMAPSGAAKEPRWRRRSNPSFAELYGRGSLLCPC